MRRSVRFHVRRLAGLLAWAGLFTLFGTQFAAAQTFERGGVLVRMGGDVHVPAETSYAVVVVVEGTLTIEGEVGTAVVAKGNAELVGANVEELLAYSSAVNLRDGSIIGGDAQLVDATLETEVGSRVMGDVQRGAQHQMSRGFWIFGALIAIGYMMAMIVGAVLAAAIAPRSVRLAGAAIQSDPLKVALWAVGVWVLLPLGAIFAIPTIVGIPMGVGMFVFILPTLAFLGYLVTAIRLGDFIIGRVRKSVEQPWPYVAAVVGTATLLVAGMLPFIGGLVPMLAGALGSGAIMLLLARRVGIPDEPQLTRAIT